MSARLDLAGRILHALVQRSENAAADLKGAQGDALIAEAVSLARRLEAACDAADALDTKVKATVAAASPTAGA